MRRFFGFAYFVCYAQICTRHYADSHGQEVIASNGWYDASDGSIHIDLYAGNDGEGVMLFTLSHELAHFIKQWSPAKYKVLANFLMKEYGKAGESVDALIKLQIEKAEANGRTLTYEQAYDEAIANSMESMLSDGSVMEKLTKLKAQDRTLLQKIKSYITELVAKIRNLYKGIDPQSYEGMAVSQMKDALERLQELFTEGLVDAGSNYMGGNNEIGIDDGESDIQFSDRDEAAFKQFSKTINDVVNKAIAGKGYVDGTLDVHKIIQTGPKVTAMVKKASNNAIDISGKSIAINTGEVWHEYKRHTNAKNEISRGQIAFTKRQFQNAIKCIINPDFVEMIFSDTTNPTQKQSFAYVKRTKRGRYVVVEAVGGKRSPYIYPVMILQFSRQKWNRMKNSGQTLGEVLHQNNPKMLSALNIQANKKSRVSAAQFASLEAIASTLRSSQLDTSVTQTDAGVNTNSDRDSEAVSTRSILANALESVAQNDMEKAKLQEYKDKIDFINSEETKLRELNSQIKELSFAKGPRDKVKIQSLRDEATKTANRINISDKQLLRLEASKPLQNVLAREKKKAYDRAKQKGEEALNAYRKKAAKELDETVARYQEARKKGIDSRNRTAMRHKIQNVVKTLNDMLLKETKERHVMEGLKGAVAMALDAVNVILSAGRSPEPKDLRSFDFSKHNDYAKIFRLRILRMLRSK